jgi:histidinol dehydrogenase
VGIDSPAGPSELLVLADEEASAEIVARELLAQAEHDPLTSVVAVVVTEAQARRVERAIAVALERDAAYPRRDIVERALAGQGGVLWVTTLEEAIDFANRFSPEHLLLASPRAETCERGLRQLRNAGTVFVGESSSNAFGDYMTGANHVLPTGGLARSYSGLSVLDFIRWTTYQRVDRDAASRLANDVGVFAAAEELPGHARAARAWHVDMGAATTATSSTVRTGE